MCEYIIVEDFLMNKYIYNKAMVFGMNCKKIIVFLALLYQPKKNTSLSAYGDSGTNAIYRNINEQFTPRCSQAEN